MALRALSACLLVLVCAPAVSAGTIHVKADGTGDYPTIQAAIDAASAGDEVVLAPGMYTGPGNYEITTRGKAVTVRGTNPDDTAVVADTVINVSSTDGATHPGFAIVSGEGPGTRIAGLTIRNGTGLITMINPFASILAGGGIFCDGTSPRIEKCVIEDNTAQQGAGLFARAPGGPTLSDCVIRGNIASSVGGGLRFLGDAQVLRCRIVDNVATGRGGAIYSFGSRSVVDSCIIQGNRAGQVAAIVAAADTIRNCVVTGNDSGSAAIFEFGNNPGRATITNCIIWGNFPSAFGLNGTTITYTNVQGGQPGDGNTDTNPRLTADGHLRADSPCINAADPAYTAAGLLDFDREPRLIAGRVDMGADEFLDTDADSLPDWWETKYFASATAADPAGDPDSDTLTNLDEYVAGSHPLSAPATLYVNPVDGSDAYDGTAIVYDGLHGPKATIQAAVDASGETGRVVLAVGLYQGPGNRDIDLHGKELSVQSTSPQDPAVVAATIIDCQGTAAEHHFAFVFHSNEGPAAALRGLTIRNGYGQSGGAIVCTTYSRPTIDGCVLTGNTATDSGGAIFCAAANPTIMNCALRANTAPYGGAIACKAASRAIIENCLLAANQASSSGGALLSADSPIVVRGGSFISNTATFSGGALWFGSVSTGYLAIPIVVENVSITGNTAGDLGGGLVASAGDLTIRGCRLIANRGGSGGALSFPSTSHHRTVAVTDCLLARNTARLGGAVRTESPGPFIGCTIVDNASDGGTEAFSCNLTNLVLRNCILWNNGAKVFTYASGNNVTYSVVQGGMEGTGNTDADPCLTPDYRLTFSSPCRNAGDPAYTPGAGEVDVDGELRVSAGRVDIGADEWLDSDSDAMPDWWERNYFGSPTAGNFAADGDADGYTNLLEYDQGTNPTVASRTYYVNPAAGDDANDGLAPASAGSHGPKKTIQSAMDACAPANRDKIVLAPGTYSGPGNRDIDFAGKMVWVQGSSIQDPAVVAATVIDCQGSPAEPHRAFLLRSFERGFCGISGLTITNGHAEAGGAILLSTGVQPAITDCMFTGNAAGNRGGAIACDGAASPTIVRCAFTGNSAPNGGAVSGQLGASPRLADCRLTGNTAATAGSAAYFYQFCNPTFVRCQVSENTGYGLTLHFEDRSSATVRACRVQNNTSTWYGGAIGMTGSGMLSPSCNLRVLDCLITGNKVHGSSGAGIYLYNAYATVTGSTICDNTAKDYGGAFHSYNNNLEYDFGPTVTNCVIYNNISQGNNTLVNVYKGTISYSIVQNGHPGTGNLNVDPLLGADYHLRADSPARNAGDPVYAMVPDEPVPAAGPVETDIDGEPRILDGRIDMGADEFLDTDGDNLPDWWEAQWFGSQTAGDPLGDPDVDGYNNLREYELATDPTQPMKVYYVDPINGDNAWSGLARAYDGTDGPKTTIQAAIDATPAGQFARVLLLPGVYTGAGNRDIDLKGKYLQVGGENPKDPASVFATLIDCGGSGANPHRAFYFHSSELPRTVLEGVSIMGGYGNAGGAFYFIKSSPTIRDCLVVGNRASEGAAVYCANLGNPIFVACRFENNTASSRGGAVGTCGAGTNPLFRDCAFRDNISNSGGALYCTIDASLTLRNCVLAGNGTYAIYNLSAADIDATGCWWGTTDCQKIAAMIYDKVDDATRGLVQWQPAVPDIDADGSVDIVDLLILATSWARTTSQSGFNPRADFNGDASVDVQDLLTLAEYFGWQMP